MPLRIVFSGTPPFAVPTLRYLIAQPDFEIVGVVTQPDRPRGRGQEIAISAVKAAAIETALPIYQPEKIKSAESLDFFRGLAPDAVVIVAYGQLISQRLIEIPRLGWINLHASLLPKYRGAAPINWAIVNGEAHTGLTTMEIDAGLDTGPTLLQYETEILPEETAGELTARLADAGAPLVAETLRKLDRGEIKPTPQDDSQATLAPPLRKEHGRINWSLNAQKIHNHIRGLEPWPGAFTTFRGKVCHIWGRPAGVLQPNPDVSLASHAELWQPGAILSLDREIFVACGQGTFLSLEFVQREGRKRVTAREFANGARLTPTERFGA